MIRLERSLRAWGTSNFESVFKQELSQVGNHVLPLQQSLSVGSHVTDTPPTVTVISAVETPTTIRIHAGVFFTSIIAGCSCADDPTPLGELTEHCELQVEIERDSAVSRLIHLG
jgi:hypothetical protein